MTHQTSWLESTGVCGGRQSQSGGSSVQNRVQFPLALLKCYSAWLVRELVVTGQVMLIRIVASLCTAAVAAASVRTASLHSQVCSEGGHGLLLFVFSSSTGVAKHS